MRRVVGHAEPSISLVGVGGGEELPADDPVAGFGAFWERTDDMAVEITLKRPDGALVLFVRDGAGGAQGSMNLTWALEPSLTESFVALVVDLSDLLASPVAVLSHRAPGRERAGWESRVGSHQADGQPVERPQLAGCGICAIGVSDAGPPPATVVIRPVASIRRIRPAYCAATYSVPSGAYPAS